MRAHPRLAAAVLAVTLLVGISLPSLSAGATGAVSPADAALAWLRGELAANDGMLTITFGSDAYPDPGLTIDAILAELAGGHGDDAAVETAIGAVDAATFDYVNQFSTFAADRAANATAKALLLQEVIGADLGPTVDLEADLRSLMATTGDELGRFNDTDLQGYGNYSNGLGQALAVLALDRTGGGVPSEAVDFLLDQQCPDGSFRLYYFGYVTSFDPFETVTDLTCTNPADGDVDATALALAALLAAPSSQSISTAIDDAVAFLLDAQLSSGAFVGAGSANANSTGLASQALRTAGEVAAADDGASFIAGLQMPPCDDLGALRDDFGALAYDQTAFDAGIDSNRDQWVRATAQGVLGLGLPSYADIEAVLPVPGLTPAACSVPPPAGNGPAATVSASTVSQGGALTVTASGFDAGEMVDVTLHSTAILLGSYAADDDGRVATTFTVPADLEPGQHRIELVGRDSGVTVSATFEVLAASSTLPATGRHTAAEAAGGLVLLAIGRSLLLMRDRRLGTVGA